MTCHQFPRGHLTQINEYGRGHKAQLPGFMCAAVQSRLSVWSAEGTRRVSETEETERLRKTPSWSPSEENSTSCVCASHCSPSPSARRVTKTSCELLLQTPRPNNEKGRRVWYSTGRGREGDKGVTHTHALCKQKHRYRCTWGHTHAQTGHVHMRSERRWLHERGEGQRPQQDRHQTRTHDLRVSSSQQESHSTKPHWMQTALKFPQLERLATTSLSDYEKCSICLHRRSAPSSPLLSGPEQHMNSAERTKTPDLLFLHERKRMWGLSLARSRSPSPARQTNRQKQLTERMSRPPACVCLPHQEPQTGPSLCPSVALEVASGRCCSYVFRGIRCLKRGIPPVLFEILIYVFKIVLNVASVEFEQSLFDMSEWCDSTVVSSHLVDCSFMGYF